jgi:hypothetical protein
METKHIALEEQPEASNSCCTPWGQIFLLLTPLRQAFTREITYFWAVVAIFGFIMRRSTDSIASMISALGLNPKKYTALIGMFHSDAIDRRLLSRCWFSVVKKKFPLFKVDGKIALVIDGIKIPKEGVKMPGRKKSHQSSTKDSRLYN